MSANRRHAPFYPGDWVEVRPLSEILATLDASGAYEGLPFMPEMVRYCGGRFQVHRRIEKIFLDGPNTLVRLNDTVFLRQLRCDGQSHGGCQMGCLLFWKEVWLRPVPAGEPLGAGAAPPGQPVADLPTQKEGRHYCQATELVHCTAPMPQRGLRQYVRDYYARGMSVREWTGMLASVVYNRLRWMCGLKRRDLVVGRLARTVSASLGLQPGELVQVKSREEIEATLDALGRNRGLGFALEMAKFCNGRFRVLRRVDRMIIEWSGEMRQLTDTVILDGTTCSGMAHRCCARDCHHLWREIWLKRVESSPAAGQGHTVPMGTVSDLDRAGDGMTASHLASPSANGSADSPARAGQQL